MDLKRQRLRMGLMVLLGIAVLALGIRPATRLWTEWTRDSSEVAPVMVAAEYLPAYSTLRADDLCEREIPKTLIPPGAISTIHEIANEKDQPLFVTAVAIPQGHPITRAVLLDASRSEALGSLIGAGQVALSFSVDSAHGVGGWIRPGDVIAIFASTPKSRLLYPSMLVLAVESERLGDQKAKKSDGAGDPLSSAALLNMTDSKVITVLAPAREAAGFMEARDAGPLSVVLRSPGDEGTWPGED